jgi:DNA modification methylase
MRLQWKGRTWEPSLPGDPGRKIGAKKPIEPARETARFVPRELAGRRGRSNTFSRLVLGDGLDALSALDHVKGAEREMAELGSKAVKLAYVDPPYLSQTDYQHEARLDGRADGRVRRSSAYRDRWGGDDEGVGAYLDMLAPRLDALARSLRPNGTLWVQLDWRAAYLARVILDEIFGRGGFKNEIVWRRAPNLGRQAASSQFGRTLDTILVYGGPQAKLVPPTRLEPIEESAVRWDDEGRPFTTAPRGDYTDASVAKLEAQGRIHRAASGKVYVKYFLVRDSDGTLCRERRVDALWTDVAPLRHAQVSERTGYPTQKPLSLLERIIQCASEPGDLVVDVFGGSGTTGEAAHRLGRRFLLADQSPLAIATARARLLRAGADFQLDTCGGRELVGDAPELSTKCADDGAIEVTLKEPREPLAWAIDADPSDGAPFACDWHDERKPGARPIAAITTARVFSKSERIAVRVYEDDGTLRECVVKTTGTTKGTRARKAAGQLNLPMRTRA